MRLFPDLEFYSGTIRTALQQLIEEGSGTRNTVQGHRRHASAVGAPRDHSDY
jgi:hypothetical protein